MIDEDIKALGRVGKDYFVMQQRVLLERFANSDKKKSPNVESRSPPPPPSDDNINIGPVAPPQVDGNDPLSVQNEQQFLLEFYRNQRLQKEAGKGASTSSDEDRGA